MLIFPTVKNAAGANSMQVSEAAFEGQLGSASPFEITDIEYDEATDMVTLTWRSSPGQTYALYSSPDLTQWDNEIDDAIAADPDRETTSYGPFPNPIEGDGTGFFRLVKNS